MTNFISKSKFKLKTIKAKIIIYILLILVVPIMLLSFTTDFLANNLLQKNFVEYTTNHMLMADKAITTYFESVAKNCEFLATNKFVKAADFSITSYVDTKEPFYMDASKNGPIERDIFELYENYALSHPNVPYVFIGLENGSFIQYPASMYNAGYDPRVRPWYSIALEEPGKVVRSEPYREFTNIEDINISTVRSVTDLNGNIIGVQAVDTSLEFLTETLNKLNFRESEFVMIINEDGTILADSSHKDNIFKNISDLNFTISNFDSSGFFEAKLNQKDVYTNTHYSEYLGWRFIYVIDSKTLNDLNTPLVIFEASIGLLSLLIAVFASLIIGNNISEPILKVGKHVTTLADNEYKLELPKELTSRDDEIGFLSSQIETMRKIIVENFNQINEYNKTLEKKVEERTKSLIDTNEYLEISLAEIEEKQAELLILNEQLENSIYELEQTKEKLIESEKFKALSQLVGGVAHELNTPLGIMLMASSHISENTRKLSEHFEQKDLSKKFLKKYINSMLESLDMIQNNIYISTTLINNFRSLSAEKYGNEKICFDIVDILKGNIASSSQTFTKLNHTFVLSLPDHLEIESYPEAFITIINHLTENSFIHGYTDGYDLTICISLEYDDGLITLTYSDNGLGVSNDILDKIFDPFFTTRKYLGSGLGLNIIYNLITNVLHGEISFSEEQEYGVTFVIKLPINFEC